MKVMKNKINRACYSIVGYKTQLFSKTQHKTQLKNEYSFFFVKSSNYSIKIYHKTQDTKDTTFSKPPGFYINYLAHFDLQHFY
jgi:hypothetical protein